MEKPETTKNQGEAKDSTPSPSKDDSLADFKSPKIKPIAQIASKLKILNDKRAKKSIPKSKTSSTRKKESSSSCKNNNEKTQPSIESSFFKAATLSDRGGHTCPLCMKHFADMNTGIAHSKNCATKNNVSTKKLLAAVALQERQAKERRAIGLPAGPFIQPKNRVPKRRREMDAGTDSDLQLALALSESLQEDEMERNFEEALLLATEHQGEEEQIVEIAESQRRQTLQNFGFSTNKPAASGLLEGPIKTRKKKHLGPTILQTRTQESRDRLLSVRIAEILMGNEAITQVSQPTYPDQVENSNTILQSRPLQKIHRTTKRLWDSAQLSTDITNFYVEDLGPVIMPIINDEQEKSANNVETRKKYPIEQNKDVFPSRPNEIIPEVDEKIPTKIPDSKICVDNTSDDVTALRRHMHVTDRQYRNTLINDWSTMVNSSYMSDVIILVKDSHIWAHKLVFHVRCYDIINECKAHEDSNFFPVKERVCWPEVDFTTALLFLEFVYTGIIEKHTDALDNKHIAAGVRGLARKYRVKALFEYLRKRKNEINAAVECRRDESSSPIVIDVSEIENERENSRDIEVEEARSGSDKIEEIHIGDDAIEENRIDSRHIVNNENGETTILKNPIAGGKFGEPTESKSEDMVELSISKLNIIEEKINYEEEKEIVDVISICSSHRADTMSPDLFDETREEEKMIEDEKSSEESCEEIPEDNSNLRVLAQLIADDVSSSNRDSQEFTPTISIEIQMENTTPTGLSVTRSIEPSGQDFPKSIDDEKNANIVQDTKDEEVKKSNSPNRCDNRTAGEKDKEIPRSLAAIFEETKNHELSISNLPQKVKSNLSLFIENVQRINAKPALDSYTDEESLTGPVDRARFRNPFNINSASRPSSVHNSPEKKPQYVDEVMCEKNLGSEKDGKKKHDESDMEEAMKDKEISSTSLQEHDETSSVDETIFTDDENVSMYSKYRKTNKHNNSIVIYRDLLKKINKTHRETFNNDKNKNEISAKDDAIDLTQESDEEMPTSSSSSINPPRARKSMNRIFDTDSNDSVINRPLDSTNDYEMNRSNVLDNCMKDEDSESSITSSPIVKGKNKRTAIEAIGVSTDGLDENIDEITSSQKDSLVFSYFDAFEMNEEILSQEHSSSTRREILSRNSSSAQRKSTSAVDSEVDEKTENEADTLKSTLSSKKHSNHSNSDIIEIDNEIFMQHSNNLDEIPSKTLTPSPYSNFSQKHTLRGKRKSDVMDSGDESSENTTENGDNKYSKDKFCRNRKYRKSSPEYSFANPLKSGERKVEESYEKIDHSLCKSSTPSPRHESHPPRKSIHHRNQHFSEGNRSSESSSNNSAKYESDDYCVDESFPKVNNSNISPDYPETDFFERNDEIFTQTLKHHNEERLTPLTSQETLRIPSPILVSSSPEIGNYGVEKFSMSEERDSNKENSIERRASPIGFEQSRENSLDGFSPLDLEELQSPQPSTSYRRCSSRCDRDSSKSVKKLMSRSISMPESTHNCGNTHQRTKSPKKSSRLSLSQESTPPRNYDTMDTPELKKELEKYGIKPQKRKRARQLLNHIYNELHPKVAIENSEKNSLNSTVKKDDEEGHPFQKTTKIRRTSPDCNFDGDKSFSQESNKSPTYVIPEEEMEVPDVEMPAKDIAGPISIKEAFIALMDADKKLHSMVLTYDPLPFELLHSTLKAQGLKCKKNDLMDFLDEECITFQVLAQTSKSRTRKVGGRKGSKRKDIGKSGGNNLDSA